MRFTSCQRCVSDNTLSHGAIHSFPFVIVQESEPSVSASVSFLSVKFAGLGVSRCDLLSRSPKPHIEARLQLLSGTRNSDNQSVRKTEAWHQGIKCLMVRSLPDVRSRGCRTAADMVGRAVVVKVNTERYPELAARYNVRGIPNFVVFYGGRPVAQQAGLVDHNQMENWLRSAGPVPAA